MQARAEVFQSGLAEFGEVFGNPGGFARQLHRGKQHGQLVAGGAGLAGKLVKVPVILDLRDKCHELVPVEPVGQRHEIHEHLFQGFRIAATVGRRSRQNKCRHSCSPSNARHPATSPHSNSATSKACPEADDDGGKRTVLFKARVRNNSCTTDDCESRKWASAASRFS